MNSWGWYEMRHYSFRNRKQLIWLNFGKIVTLFRSWNWNTQNIVQENLKHVNTYKVFPERPVQYLMF